MIRGGFLSNDARAHLEVVVRRPREKHGVARRANAILLLDDGMSCGAVAQVLYLDDWTVRGWYERFTSGGAEALRAFGWKGGAGKLSRCQEAELVVTLTGRRLWQSTATVIGHTSKRATVWSTPRPAPSSCCIGWTPRKTVRVER